MFHECFVISQKWHYAHYIFKHPEHVKVQHLFKGEVLPLDEAHSPRAQGGSLSKDFLRFCVQITRQPSARIQLVALVALQFEII